MKLPSFKRLRSSDFGEKDQQLVDQLSISINEGFDRLYFAMGNKLSLVDNIACDIITVEIEVDSSGNPTSTTFAKLSRTDSVIGCNVIKVENLTNANVFPTTCPFITFVQNNNSLILQNITGLPVSNTFRIKFIAYF
jgi:hypothetical protein